MPNITDIKRRILALAPAPFQEFCDTLISKQGYGAIHGFGMKSGTGNTTKGNPDTYFRKQNGKYVFVVYTIQQESICSKIKEDIDKCLDFSKTGLHVEDIEEIICCHTSSNLSAGNDKYLHDYCESKGILLTIWGIDELANLVHNRYRSLGKDFLGLSISTNQILSVDEFIVQYDANDMAAPLNTIFQYREKEKKEINDALKKSSIVVVTGKAGAGKTRLVLEVARDVSLNAGYNLLCVKNHNLGLYDDLISATEKPDKYLFFIDDANELAGLKSILEYTTKRYLGYEVKIILTVRDYAKNEVISSVKEYSVPKIIEIPPFTDEEIKGFLQNNLKIQNEVYIRQIIHISEGNPRIAYMAGRLAVEKQNLTSIKDASQLYEAYYKKYVDGSIGRDDALCFTAGVLSIINAVLLNDISALRPLLDDYGITDRVFLDTIRYLFKLEVVEIQFNQVAMFSDQCLANYMLYYVFFEKKIVSFSKVLEIGYKHFRNGVIRSINTILSLFKSDETKAYCEQEILKVWDNFDTSQDECYEDFVKDFHVFRPEKAFLLAQRSIDAINSEEFAVTTVDFSANVYTKDESVLAYLTGYQHSEYLEYVIDILFKYCSKNVKTLVSGYKWLENSYGVGVFSYKYRYQGQKMISEYIYNSVLKGNVIAEGVGFQWSKYSLGFKFLPIEMGRDDKLIMYNLEIKQSEGLVEYREVCWKILINLASKPAWNNALLSLLESYVIDLYDKPDYEIVSSEVKYIEELLTILKCNRISYLKVIQRLLLNGDKMNVKYNKKWDKLLQGKEWELYQTLRVDYELAGLNYEDYQCVRTKSISEYGQSISVSDIPSLVQSMNSILSDTLLRKDSYDSYNIVEGFEMLVQHFDVEHLQELMRAFVQFGKNISMHPEIVLEKLNKNMNSMQLLSFINQSDFPQKYEWLFGFFNTLPDTKVTSEILNEFLAFLRNDSDKNINLASYRSLRVLDKFLHINQNIYPVSCAILFKKRNCSPFVVNLYFCLLFNESIYLPKELLHLFQSDINLLQEIYFYMLKQNETHDLNGTFLLEFLSLGESWIQKYSELFWKNEIKHDFYINNALWKSEKYKDYFDYMFYNFPKDKMYTWRIKESFRNVMTHVESDENIIRHQKEWIRDLIEKNAFSSKIVIIFNFVCELNEDIRKESIKIFLDNNQDFEMFNKLSLLPTHLVSNGNFTSVYKKQIDFLESLLPYLHGLKFLKHKDKIRTEVEKLYKMIQQEEVEEICRDLYM